MSHAGLIIIAASLVLGFALIPAIVGDAKGRSFLGFFLFGLFLFLPALITALIISPLPVPCRVVGMSADL